MTTATRVWMSLAEGIPPTIVPPAGPITVPRMVVRLLRNPLEAWTTEIYQKPIVRYSMGGRDTAFVMAPELVQEVFVDSRESFPKNPLDRRVLGRALGQGIMVAEGERWRWQRRTVAPLFRQSDLLADVPTIEAVAKNVLAVWQQSPPGAIQMVDRQMVDLTFDVIRSTMLAADADFDGEAVKRAIVDYLGPITWEIVYDFMGIPEWVPHPGTFRMGRSAALMRRTVAEVVDRRRHAPVKTPDLLARLMDARDPETGRPMDREVVIDNLVTFLVAGHETTAQALTWTLFLVACFPDWQDRLVDEITAVVGDGPVTADHLDRLETVERVLKESMRLFPPAPAITRVTGEPITLGGEPLGKGAKVLIPIYVIHRHRMLWREPDRFDPDRFLPDREAARPRHAYMPFGAGARSCIGTFFAMMEAKIVLATLLRGFRLKSVPGHVPLPVTRITMRPSGGMPLIVTPR